MAIDEDPIALVATRTEEGLFHVYVPNIPAVSAINADIGVAAMEALAVLNEILGWEQKADGSWGYKE